MTLESPQQTLAVLLIIIAMEYEVSDSGLNTSVAEGNREWQILNGTAGRSQDRGVLGEPDMEILQVKHRSGCFPKYCQGTHSRVSAGCWKMMKRWLVQRHLYVKC